MKKTVIMCDYVSDGLTTCSRDISASPGYTLRVPTHKGSHDAYDVIIEDWGVDRTKRADLCPEHKLAVLKDLIALLPSDTSTYIKENSK